MTISVGQQIPEANLHKVGPGGAEPVNSVDVLSKGKVVIFGVPGAFTPTCSDYHLPGFLIRAEDLRAKGVDQIVCISVNDPFVMSAWADAQGVGEQITMLADGSANLTQAMGLEVDLSAAGLGTRSKRFAAIIEDGTVTHLAIEPAPGLEVSSAEAVLAVL